MALQQFQTVTVQHPKFDWVVAKVRVSYDDDTRSHAGDYLETATLCIETGACSVQVYATAVQLRQLAESMLNAADAVEQGVMAAAEAA